MRHKSLRICALVLVISMLFPIGVQAVDVDKLNKNAIEINAAEMTISEKNRFRDVITLEADVVSTAFDADMSISTTKALLDFAGNAYTVIECQPSGYMIYHNASGQFVETSATSPSPYLNYTQNLYYAGPTQYFVLENGAYKHTILDETYSQSVVDAYVSICTQANDSYVAESNIGVLEYIENGAKTNVSTVEQIIGTASETAPTYITNAYCLSNCETESEMSYFSKDACGYIAAALLMLWYRETIDERYLTTNNSTNQSYLSLKNGVHVFNGNPKTYYDGRTFSFNLWRWHSDQGQSDYVNGYYGTGAGDIAETLESYVKGKGLSFTYDIDIFPTTSSIISKLDSRDRPYLLWGPNVQPVDESRVACQHAVTVYGHWNGYLLCHFGWANYNCSSVKGFWASGLMLYQ